MVDQQTVIVYHVKTPSTICFDGYCAATLFWRKYGDTAHYLPAVYHDTPNLDDFRGKDVIFVDFSYNVEHMDNIFNVAKSLLVFDHHLPKAKSFEGRDYAHFSATESGSVLAWRYLNGAAPLPDMVALIDDGDRYVNALSDVFPFASSLSVEQESFAHWSKLIDTLVFGSREYDEFIKRGIVLDKYNTARVASLTKDAFPITLCGIKGLIVNSNKFYSHLAGIRLAEYSGTFGAVFYVRPDSNVEVSLRRVDPDTDVEQIAKTFGGGGHKGAAAFSVSLDKFKELLSPSNVTHTYARLDSATKSFGLHIDKLEKPLDLPNISEAFLQHLQSELGSFIADDIHFVVSESVGHPGFFTRIGSKLANAIGLPTTGSVPKWYHKVFPYHIKRDLTFDDDLIRDMLLECRPGDPALNEFLACKLRETVNVGYKAELQTSIYYIHVSVNVPGSSLTVRHTFEVVK